MAEPHSDIHLSETIGFRRYKEEFILYFKSWEYRFDYRVANEIAVWLSSHVDKLRPSPPPPPKRFYKCYLCKEGREEEYIEAFFFGEPFCKICYGMVSAKKWDEAHDKLMDDSQYIR